MDFSPSVYEHAAFHIGRTPWEASRDADLLFEAHAAAYRCYRHRPIVVGIDIYNLEAEAHGGKVEPAHGTGIPAIKRPVLGSVAELARLAPLDPDRGGRIPMLLGVARRLAAAFPEAEVRVPVSGPFSIASSLLGFESLLTAAYSEPEATRDALVHLVDGQAAFCAAIRRAGLDVAFFESAAAPPLLSPDLFCRVELPALTAIMRRAAEVVGHPISCIIGGDTTPILDAMLATGTGYVVCPIETNQEAFMRKVWDRKEVRVRVNTLSHAMVYGTRQQLRAEFERICRLTAGRGNVCLGTGALPYETPPENVLYLKELAAAESA